MEGVVRHQLEEVDKENFKRELREALRILIAAGAEEVSTHRSDGQRIVCKGKGAKNLEEFLEKVTCSRRHGVKRGTLYSICNRTPARNLPNGCTEVAVDENDELGCRCKCLAKCNWCQSHDHNPIYAIVHFQTN